MTKNTRGLLDSKLLAQPAESADPVLLKETMEFVRKLSAHEGNICILSDLKARRSYLFYSSLAHRIGLMQGEFEINSIWEDELLGLIHPEDLEKKYRLELAFFHVCKSMDKESRKGNELVTSLRIRALDGAYLKLKHRLIYINGSDGEDMVMALCMYNLIIEYPGFDAPNGVIVNLRTGELLKNGLDTLLEILSEREKQIMELIRLGNRSKDIAEKLAISIHTVNRHRQNIFDKLNVTNAIEACRVAEKARLFLESQIPIYVNNPFGPEVISVGNNPQKLQVYGAVLSFYISRMIKLVNRKGLCKSSLIVDEFPTIFFNNMDSLIATARSNKVATTLAVQDFSQLKKDCGSDQADVIVGIIGNIISGQVTGDTAKKLSETFGRIVQDRESRSISSMDVSVTQSTQLDHAVPASRIASLSSGEFAGILADNPEERIALKLFHSELQNDNDAIAEEKARFKPIPVVDMVSTEDIQKNYLKIKDDVEGY